jgi:3-hydroxyethyl bacteriochlorophyllide a dehydrogenase
MMQTDAILLKGPCDLAIDCLTLSEPGANDLVVEVAHSGISTGTEKLFYTGKMPPFPGMGYPLVPGYEASGIVVEAGRDSGFSAGDAVFVPGANCFDGARGLFGGAARYLVTDAARAARIDSGMGAEGALLALAATARHAMAGLDRGLPELIVGHGVLGRLLARLVLAAGGPPPTVWETAPARRIGGDGYRVIDPEEDPRRDYSTIYDASGNGSLLDLLIGRIAKGGEVVLAGFYTEPLSFAFPPAFMKEVRLRVAAEWQPKDLEATRALIEAGALSLSGLISHRASTDDAPQAYRTAFEDSTCLKMILDWDPRAAGHDDRPKEHAA